MNRRGFFGKVLAGIVGAVGGLVAGNLAVIARPRTKGFMVLDCGRKPSWLGADGHTRIGYWGKATYDMNFPGRIGDAILLQIPAVSPGWIRDHFEYTFY